MNHATPGSLLEPDGGSPNSESAGWQTEARGELGATSRAPTSMPSGMPCPDPSVAYSPYSSSRAPLLPPFDCARMDSSVSRELAPAFVDVLGAAKEGSGARSANANGGGVEMWTGQRSRVGYAREEEDEIAQMRFDVRWLQLERQRWRINTQDEEQRSCEGAL